MKNLILEIGIIILKGIYAIIKLFPIHSNKITFISRQGNSASKDFQMLSTELIKQDSNVEIIILCKTISNKFWKSIEYCFHILRQMYHIATSKVVILDSYCIPVCVLKHKKSLVVIQIWHALGSLKQFGYSVLDKKDGRNGKLANSMKMHRNYTYILTSSEVSKPFFQEAFDAKENQMLVMNLPRVDFLKSKEAEEQIQNKFYEIYPEANNQKKNILYCPTKRKDGKIPVSDIIKDVPFKFYNLIVKLHNGKEMIFIDGNKIEKGRYFTGLELLHVGDYIITDYSAIVYEASITQKPIYFYVYDYEEYQIDRGTYIDYQKEMPGPICKEFKDIIQLIQQNQYDKNKIENFCNKYIENIEENATEKLAKKILTFVGG